MNIRFFILLAAAVLCRAAVFSQKEVRQPATKPAQPLLANGSNAATAIRKTQAVQVLEVPVPEGGANGAAVAYHPTYKLYYAAQAGNEIYPLVVFDENGTIQSAVETSTLIDVRGLWYNAQSGTIAGNAFQDAGWFTYKLNSKGLPEALQVTNPGLNQPDEHSAGIFNPDADQVLFLSGTRLICYRSTGEPTEQSIQLFPGDNPSTTDFKNEYNTRSAIYTGYPQAELGLLNVARKRVELYNRQTGTLSRIIQLPISFVPESFFNFSFCNGLYWLFNKQSRRWIAFKEVPAT